MLYTCKQLTAPGNFADPGIEEKAAAFADQILNELKGVGNRMTESMDMDTKMQKFDEEIEQILDLLEEKRISGREMRF